MCVIILNNIETSNLLLIPVTYEITSSLLNGSIDEIKKLGITADDNWPTNDTLDILPIINKFLSIDKIPTGFEFWMIVKKESMSIIGDIGFHGKPDEKGEVEIGYGLVENVRGQGIGSEALKAIVDWALSHPSVKIIKADCLLDNKASARILEKVGMREVNRNNELIYWELRN